MVIATSFIAGSAFQAKFIFLATIYLYELPNLIK